MIGSIVKLVTSSGKAVLPTAVNVVVAALADNSRDKLYAKTSIVYVPFFVSKSSKSLLNTTCET